MTGYNSTVGKTSHIYNPLQTEAHSALFSASKDQINGQQ